MKIISKYPFPFLLLVALLCYFGAGFLEANYERELDDKLKMVSLPDTDLDILSTENSYMMGLDGKEILSEKDLHRKLSSKELDHTYHWGTKNCDLLGISGLGTDNKHHFSNSFLVGYCPFKTKNIWEPMYTLAYRLKYLLDEKQFSGKKDLWLNSKEAYMRTFGDCEDHSILLADWLISLGYDARVALGKYKKGGHAWVVLYEGGNSYILEATNKRRYRSWSNYPMTKYAKYYKPVSMFNKEYLWEIINKRRNTDYSEDNWKRRSVYVRYKKS